MLLFVPKLLAWVTTPVFEPLANTPLPFFAVKDELVGPIVNNSRRFQATEPFPGGEEVFEPIVISQDSVDDLPSRADNLSW